MRRNDRIQSRLQGAVILAQSLDDPRALLRNNLQRSDRESDRDDHNDEKNQPSATKSEHDSPLFLDYSARLGRNDQAVGVDLADDKLAARGLLAGRKFNIPRSPSVVCARGAVRRPLVHT